MKVTLKQLPSMLWRFNPYEDVEIVVRGETVCTVELVELLSSDLKGVRDELDKLLAASRNRESAFRQELYDIIDRVEGIEEEIREKSDA